MFKKKTRLWLSQAQNAKFPILLKEMTPQDETRIIAAFLRKKIGLKDLNGIVSPDDKSFTPTLYFSQIISNKLDSIGAVDVCDLIEATNLPGDIIEHRIRTHTQDVKGFFDVIKRKFYTRKGAMRELNYKLSSSASIDLKFLLNTLYWTEDHLESILDLIAQKGEFYGYIDPIKQRLYNFTLLDFSSPKKIQQNFKYFQRFITTSFNLDLEVSITDISKLTRLTKEECLGILEKNRDKINFIFSSNFDFLYPTITIFKNVLEDIIVYRNIPIKFWLTRLDVDRTDFIAFLSKINEHLKGTLTKNDFELKSFSDWFQTGIDVEGLALLLNIETLELLDSVVKLAKVLHLRIIAGETSNPFLVKGIKKFEIFCQVDTSSYDNPRKYFECQNCRRVMCLNCRSTGSKHECPFCGNISAFIIDLPRHCEHCQVNYTHSFNLTSTEKCYFCQKGPMKVGWIGEQVSLPQKSSLDQKLANYLEQNSKSFISIREIISTLGKTDNEIISILEDNILNGNIQGHINIRKMVLELELVLKEYSCSVCEQSYSETEKYQCNSCEANVCLSCYNEMISVGMVFCSECGGDLQLKVE